MEAVVNQVTQRILQLEQITNLQVANSPLYAAIQSSSGKVDDATAKTAAVATDLDNVKTVAEKAFAGLQETDNRLQKFVGDQAATQQSTGELMKQKFDQAMAKNIGDFCGHEHDPGQNSR